MTSFVLNNIFRVLKFCLDLYLYWLFTRDFLYFYKLKKERADQMTRFNIFILIWAFVLMSLSFAHSFLAFISGYAHLNFDVVRFIDRNLIPGKDFLISTTMLYLFYYQSSNTMKMKKMKLRQKTKKLGDREDLENEREDRTRQDSDSCDTERVKSFLIETPEDGKNDKSFGFGGLN